MCSRKAGIPRLYFTVVLLSAMSSLWSQAQQPARQAPDSAGQAFSRFDDSLTRAAEVLLAPAVQTEAVPAAARAVLDSSPGTTLEVRGDGPRRTGGWSVARERVDLLRPAIEPILRNRGVPAGLAAVVAVESGGRSTALSPKGARGLWQLMPDTARRYGLRVDELADDRLDTFKATDAAARYLHDLYAQFGDWRLVLAAYNTGEANVGSAILRAHTQDFDQLINLRMLPQETRDYVPRVLAAAPSLGQTFGIVRGREATSIATIFAASRP